MPKRKLDEENEDKHRKKYFTADTWNDGYLHEHKPSLEKRHAASRQLCSSDHQVTLQSVLRCLRLVIFLQALISHNFTADSLMTVTFSGLEGVLPVSKRRILLDTIPQTLSFIGSEQPKSGQPYLIKLPREGELFQSISNYMRSTIRLHRNNHSGTFSDYDICLVQQIVNQPLWNRYVYRRGVICSENGNEANEHLLFHGSPHFKEIIGSGFDESHANKKAMFGGAIYLTDVSSKANLYVYGEGGGTGCMKHNNKECVECERHLLLCRTSLGAAFTRTDSYTYTSPPPGHHSVTGVPSKNGLWHPEFAVYLGQQVYPQFLLTYKLVK